MIKQTTKTLDVRLALEKKKKEQWKGKASLIQFFQHLIFTMKCLCIFFIDYIYHEIRN